MMDTRTITDGTRAIAVSEICLGARYFDSTTDEETAFPRWWIAMSSTIRGG